MQSTLVECQGLLYQQATESSDPSSRNDIAILRPYFIGPLARFQGAT